MRLSLWISQAAWHQRSDTDASRMIRQSIHEQTELGDGFDEHRVVTVRIDLLEARRPNQKRSRTNLRKRADRIERELRGPVLAGWHQIAERRSTKRWCTDGEEPGCWCTITDYEET